MSVDSESTSDFLKEYLQKIQDIHHLINMQSLYSNSGISLTSNPSCVPDSLSAACVFSFLVFTYCSKHTRAYRGCKEYRNRSAARGVDGSERQGVERGIDGRCVSTRTRIRDA